MVTDSNIICAYFQWDTENPTDRSRWASQHPPLARLDPPYVYNVFQDDVEGFVSAVIGAIKNPIPSFVLDDMKIKSVETRLDAILSKDWEGEATRLGLMAKGHKRRLPRMLIDRVYCVP